MIELYCVRDNTGKYFVSSNNRNWNDPDWTDKLKSATFYTDIGQPKARVTTFSKEFPDRKFEIVILHVTEFGIYPYEPKIKKKV